MRIWFWSQKAGSGWDPKVVFAGKVLGIASGWTPSRSRSLRLLDGSTLGFWRTPGKRSQPVGTIHDSVARTKLWSESRGTPHWPTANGFQVSRKQDSVFQRKPNGRKLAVA